MPFKKIAEEKDRPICLHPEHKPPSHIVLKPGIYQYTCPSCGKVTIVRIQKNFL